MTWMMVVQWLHVLAGLTWFGGYLVMALGVWPALLRRPAGEARAVWEGLEKGVGPLMLVSGTVVFWAGVARGTLLGPVRSFEVLFGSAYGLTFVTALLLTLGLTVYGAVSSRKLPAMVWEGDRFRTDAAAYLRRSYALSLGLFAAVLACMVLMRFGL